MLVCGDDTTQVIFALGCVHHSHCTILRNNKAGDFQISIISDHELAAVDLDHFH